jgi:hypothetical protein
MRRLPAPLAAGLLVSLVLALAAASAHAQGVRRVVIIKADGLAFDIVERAVRERNPRTGKSRLPWIEHVFFEGGTRISNFYVRGMSLSGPSWSMLDTGHHLQIKGNVEFDRFTNHPYDYLNFLPFWLGNAAERVVDMWGTGVLDELGIPLLLDAFPFDARYQSFQLYQRGSRWMTLRDALQKRITTRSVRQLIDEWYIGIDTRAILTEQLERELIEKLKDPGVRYLDYYTTEFDHAAHHNRDLPSHLVALTELDGLVGRVWTAISRTPLAADTALILVSDHGINTDERNYSQGFNLVTLLAGGEGGGHHVVTKRRLMTDYSIKGIYPLVPLVTTASADSRYLRGEADSYPTALVDFDGNERVSIHLRHPALNTLHVLLQQIRGGRLAEPVQAAAIEAFFTVLDEHRPAWQQTAVQLREELGALRAQLARLRAGAPAPPPERRRRSKRQQPRNPADTEARVRALARIETWAREEREYSSYLETLDRLLGLTREALTARSTRIEDVIAPRAMGESNTLRDLQQYVVGPAPGGLVLAPDGRLDLERSFERIDYFELLHSRRVRNNVQEGLGDRPVSFTAVSVPCASVSGADAAAADTCIWVDGGSGAEALVLSRRGGEGRLLLRYLPVSGVSQGRDGVVRLTPAPWRDGLPLGLWEDPRLQLPSGTSRAWLDAWHTDEEWLGATHMTQYSNAIVGLHEHFARHLSPSLDPAAPGLSDDERLLRRFRLRQRRLVEADILVHASDHWNFDVRGFNPGGNHGSFFRPSTHATLMFAGGAGTGIPRGLDVRVPYDSLSFMPTVLTMMGFMRQDGTLSPDLAARGFGPLPGRPIGEVLDRGYGRTTATVPENDVIETTAPPSSP